MFKIISGGQTGIDQLALQVATDLGFETGGTSCKCWKTEEGKNELLLKRYGLKECTRSGYPARTKQNIKDSDLTIILYDNIGPGSRLTMRSCEEYETPYLQNPTPEQVEQSIHKILEQRGQRGQLVKWTSPQRQRPIVINFAGTRGSKLASERQQYYKHMIHDILSHIDDPVVDTPRQKITATVKKISTKKNDR